MRARTLIYALPLAFIGLFFLYPLAAILRLSLAGGDGLAELAADHYYLEVVWFSAWQAALSTLLTLAAGLPIAFALARYRFRGRTLLRALATVPFVLPTTVVAAAFTALLGPRGVVNSWAQAALGMEQPPLALVGTLGAVLLGHVFYNLSVVVRVVGGFWSTLDPQLEQAAATLGASRARALLHVTLPLLLPAIGAAALLVFIFTFGSFGVVLLLGGPRFATVEVEIYRQTAQLLRLDVAGALALVQVAATLLMTAAYTRLQRRGAALERRAASWEAKPRGWRARLLVAGTAAFLLALVGAPLLALAARSLTSAGPGDTATLTLEHYRALAQSRRGALFAVPPLRAALNSLLLAGMATALSLLVGVPAAYLLERTPRGAGEPGRPAGWRRLAARALDPLFTLPLGVSAVTLGLGYIVALGPLGLLRSPWLVLAAHTLLAFPFVVRGLLPALRALDPRLRDAASALGAGPARVLAEVDMPLLAPALLSGAVFSFTVSLGDFGAALLLSRPELPTAPVAIARLLGQPGESNYGQALALSTVLMLVAAAGFVALERLRPRGSGEL